MYNYKLQYLNINYKNQNQFIILSKNTIHSYDSRILTFMLHSNILPKLNCLTVNSHNSIRVYKAFRCMIYKFFDYL